METLSYYFENPQLIETFDVKEDISPNYEIQSILQDVNLMYDFIKFIVDSENKDKCYDFAKLYDHICEYDSLKIRIENMKENLDSELMNKMKYIDDSIVIAREMTERHYWREIITSACILDSYVSNNIVELVNDIDTISILRDVIDPLMYTVITTVYQYRNIILEHHPLFHINIENLLQSEHLSQKQKEEIANVISK
jgi:hypothetical protein